MGECWLIVKKECCWWNAHRRFQYFDVLFLIEMLLILCMIFHNKWLYDFPYYSYSVCFKKDNIGFYCQHFFVIVQQLGQYIFRNSSFISTQFNHYFVQPFIRKRLMYSKHFYLRKSQIMMNCVYKSYNLVLVQVNFFLV